MAKGLQHIHFKEFVHRDIKPANVLISFPDQYGRITIKLGDFGRGRWPSNSQLSPEMTKILKHIHENNSAHRDIKQDRDFDLCRTPHFNHEFNNSISVKATLNFMAPEVLQLFNAIERQGTKESDMFSSGLVFFGLLTGGKHPFGSTDSDDHINQLISNILQGKAVNMKGKKCFIFGNVNRFDGD